MQCEMVDDGKSHSSRECHMDSTLPSLHYLKNFLVEQREKLSINNKQKLLRSMKVCIDSWEILINSSEVEFSALGEKRGSGT